MLQFYCLKSDQYSVTNILYVDWFLLSKLFLKRVLSSSLHVNMTNHNNNTETRGKAGIKIQNPTNQHVQHPSPTPRKFRTFEKVLPRELGLSEGQICTRNFI